MTAPGHADASIRPRRRRWLRGAVWAAVVLAVAAFARFAYLRITREPTPRPDYWQAEMAKLDPPPPGALSDDEARDLLTDRPWETHPALTSFNKFDVGNLLAGSWSTTRPEVAAAEQVFQSDAFRNQRQRMREAVQRGWYVPFPLWPSTLDPTPFAAHRQWAKWLVAHSRWARESAHDTPAAIEDWLTTLQMCRQLRRSRMVIPLLVETAIEALVAYEMMLAARESPAAVDTADLARRIDQIHGPPLLPSQLLRGERIYCHNEIDSMFVREGGDWLVLSEPAGRYSAALAAAGGGSPGRPSRLWNLASPLYYDIHTARRTVDHYFASFDACLDIATCTKIENNAPDSPPIGELNALSGFPTIPWFSMFGWKGSGQAAHTARPLNMYYAARCRTEAATTMFALGEYHRQNNQYPDRLDQLVPEFLPRLPIDYADRKTLRYRRTGDAYILYSVGVNGVDDGGRFVKWPGAFDEANPDTVFSAIKRGEVQP